MRLGEGATVKMKKYGGTGRKQAGKGYDWKKVEKNWPTLPPFLFQLSTKHLFPPKVLHTKLFYVFLTYSLEASSSGGGGGRGGGNLGISVLLSCR